MSLAPHPTIEGHYREAGKRQEYVDSLFDDAAPHYEWICQVMSFGSGALYRRQALQRLGVRPGMTVLDVATGTGLVAREAVAARGRLGSDRPRPEPRHAGPGARTAARPWSRPAARPCPSPTRASTPSAWATPCGTSPISTPPSANITACCGRAGGCSSSRSRGRPRASAWHWLRLYLKRLVPLVTRLGTGSADAQRLMDYYWDTIEHCVPPEAILDAMRRSGFQATRQVQGGLSSEYVGVKRPYRQPTAGRRRCAAAATRDGGSRGAPCDRDRQGVLPLT